MTLSAQRPIEIAAPDITRWKNSNTGIDHVWHFDSGRPGPRVMVQALTHGNELCGAIALDTLLEQGLRPDRGSLTLAFANTDAFARWNPDDPDRSRFVDEDYNRVWADETLLGSRDSVELRRARLLRPFVDAADLLLDIHSMHEPCRPIMVCGATGKGGDKSAAYARRVGVPGDLLIDTGHPAGLRMIERGGFGDPSDPRTAILIECGQHWSRASVDVALDTLLRFLRETGVVEASRIDPRLHLSPPAVQRIVRVTEPVVARSLSFRFVAPFTGLEVIPRKGDPIATDGDDIIRAPYDNTVLVMPSMAQLRVGTTMVRLGRYES
ncbi:MAG: succinylglutamate desuccinylase [Burkholderiaceae bacterium]